MAIHITIGSESVTLHEGHRYRFVLKPESDADPVDSILGVVLDLSFTFNDQLCFFVMDEQTKKDHMISPDRLYKVEDCPME